MLVERRSPSQMRGAGIRRAQALWESIWPNKRGRDALEAIDAAERDLEARLREDLLNRQRLAYHVIEEDDRMLAICRSFARDIRFLETGERRTVLALAGVCSSPSARGLGYGKAVVEDAFARLTDEEGFDLCLFQTGVPDFYAKLGSAVVENEFVDRSEDPDAQESPWWDVAVMRFPGGGNWGEGLVDLGGPGY